MEIDLLRQNLECDPEKGILLWRAKPEGYYANSRLRNSWNAKCAGKPALNNKSSHGYRVGKIGSVNLYAHRVIWAMHYGSWPENHIDHINGDTSDNRISNLRDVPNKINLRNMKRNVRNKTGIPGVSRHYDKWVVKAGTERVGRFKCFGMAVMARKLEEAKGGFLCRAYAP